MADGASASVNVARQGLAGAKILSLSEDLPIVIEIVDAAEKIRAFLPTLDGMVTEDPVTLERAEVLMYRAPGKPART